MFHSPGGSVHFFCGVTCGGQCDLMQGVSGSAVFASGQKPW